MAAAAATSVAISLAAVVVVLAMVASPPAASGMPATGMDLGSSPAGSGSRRALLWKAADGGYISHHAVLHPDRVPFMSIPAASYYHGAAGGGAKPNPYHRGCTILTRCRV
ncbi:protein RALF-like 22 [Oryza brachyantha]|uniref:protein RALF-like 22 n=1 Tax=Oryza brachyantha TaxID=4533 RepID=UPI001ADCCD0D|nr:protein RALF-like 22 [Oryza brachyantha]